MYTILIVDDERPAQTFLKAICQKYCPAFDTILLSGSADDALRLMAQAARPCAGNGHQYAGHQWH